MKTNPKILLLLVCFSFYSCGSGDKKESNENFTQLSIENISKVYDFVKSGEILELNKIVPLETGKASIIGEIGAVQVYNSLIYIFDESTKAIIIFNKEGGFVNKIEPLGNGPQEAIQPYDIALDTYSEQLLLLDRIGKKILGYTPKGEYKETIELPDVFEKFYVLDSDKIVLYSNYFSRSGKRFTIVDKKGEIISQFNDIPSTDLIGHTDQIFAGNLDNCLYVLPNDNSIYTIKEGKQVKLYDIDFDGFFIDGGGEKTQVELDEIKRLDKKQDIITQISNISLVENTLYFSFVHRHQERSAFFDLATGKPLKEVGELSTDINNLLFPNVPPIGQTATELIYVEYASKITDRYNRLIENPEYAPYVEQFSYLFENDVVNENSNPILFFYAIKQ